MSAKEKGSHWPVAPHKTTTSNLPHPCEGYTGKIKGCAEFVKGQGNIKPIETLYNGYRFRSRLEARWAVFFDTLNIVWHYEPEGFDLDGTWYLPDFRLQFDSESDYRLTIRRVFWIEIKPFPEEDTKKYSLLAKSTDENVCVFAGSPDERFLTIQRWWTFGKQLKHNTYIGDDWTDSVPSTGSFLRWMCSYLTDLDIDEEIQMALIAARSYRFEEVKP